MKSDRATGIIHAIVRIAINATDLCYMKQFITN